MAVPKILSQVETLSVTLRNKRFPYTEAFYWSILLHYQFPSNLLVTSFSDTMSSLWKQTTGKCARRRSRTFRPTPQHSPEKSSKCVEPFSFICFSDIEYQCSHRQNNMHKLCEKESYGARHEEASAGWMERERLACCSWRRIGQKKNKKVNFIELLVIYLISVFMRLSNSSASGFGKSMYVRRGQFALSYIIRSPHCTIRS